MDVDQELLTIVYADLIENAGEMMWPVLSETHDKSAMVLFESPRPDQSDILSFAFSQPIGSHRQLKVQVDLFQRCI